MRPYIAKSMSSVAGCGSSYDGVSATVFLSDFFSDAVASAHSKQIATAILCFNIVFPVVWILRDPDAKEYQIPEKTRKPTV